MFDCHKNKPRQTKHTAVDVWCCVVPDVFSSMNLPPCNPGG